MTSVKAKVKKKEKDSSIDKIMPTKKEKKPLGFTQVAIMLAIMGAIGGSAYYIHYATHMPPFPSTVATVTSIESAKTVQAPVCREGAYGYNSHKEPLPVPSTIEKTIESQITVVPHIERPHPALEYFNGDGVEGWQAGRRPCKDFYDSSQWPVKAKATVKLSVDGLDEQIVEIPLPLKLSDDGTTSIVTLPNPGDEINVYVKDGTVLGDRPGNGSSEHQGSAGFLMGVALVVFLTYYIYLYENYR